jgi:hypothetical protein
VALKGEPFSRKCNMTELRRGDCSQDVERTPTGQLTELCSYHSKVCSGLLSVSDVRLYSHSPLYERVRAAQAALSKGRR